MSQDLTLPSLQELFSANAVRVVEHIPARSRTLWATVLASELDRARTQNSQPAWTRLFMLAKCCLWVPDGARGGRKSRGAESIPAIVADRLRKWQQGSIAELWESYQEQTKRSPPGRRPRKSPEEVQTARAKRLAAEGLFGRACEALASEGLFTRNPELIQMLKDLHPQGHQVQPTQEDQADPIEFSREGVKAGVESFNRLAGAGRSDLKPQHLKEAVGCKSPAAATVVLDKLTRLVNFLVAGEACPEVAPFLAGAPLHAGKKADGGVRPIAVGETLRRLVGKCCVGDSSIKDAVKQLLEPRQLGVGTRGGAEVLTRAATTIVQEHGHDPVMALLQIDSTNAFNPISRDKILLEVDALLPSLSDWMRCCYEGDPISGTKKPRSIRQRTCNKDVC